MRNVAWENRHDAAHASTDLTTAYVPQIEG